MKVVIFAGGLGTRLSEETDIRPKPMVEIGGKPILWHIMKIYSHHGFNDFVVCCGYKGNDIKDYFASYYQRASDLTFDFRDGKSEVTVHRTPKEKWRVTLVDTGLKTMTGGRLARVKEFVGNEDFCLTYGDGLSDVNIKEVVAYHKSHGKVATVTAVQPPGRFGALEIDEGNVKSFVEKPIGDGGWINGGFLVLKPSVFDYIPEDSDDVMWEAAPMKGLAAAGQLHAHKHHGFWQAMDTIRDKHLLEDMCANGKAPWIIWKD